MPEYTGLFRKMPAWTLLINAGIFPTLVTEEDCLSETDLSGPPSFFWMLSLLLKELIFIFVFTE